MYAMYAMYVMYAMYAMCAMCAMCVMWDREVSDVCDVCDVTRSMGPGTLFVLVTDVSGACRPEVVPRSYGLYKYGVYS